MGGGRTGASTALGTGDAVAGRYVVEACIGSGVGGRIYRAKDAVLRREVVVKILTGSEGEAALAEHAGLASVDHPNVVPIFDVGVFAGAPFVVSAFDGGMNLKQLIRMGGPPDVDVAVAVIRQVASGISAIHRVGLTHGDVRLTNVLVSRAMRVRLADRGVGPGLQSPPRDLLTSPEYAAPEVILGHDLPALRRRARDVYALGVCAYELLTGRVPFAEARVEETLKAHLEQTPKAPSTLNARVSAQMDAPILAALAKDASVRPSAMGFAAQLDRALGDRAGSEPRALIVDDDPDMREALRLALQLGLPQCDVHEAEDGLIALAMIRSKAPQVVLLDLEMPWLDGFGLLAALSEENLLQRLRIIVISSKVDDDARARLSELGINEVVSKPFDPKEIAQRVSAPLRS